MLVVSKPVEKRGIVNWTCQSFNISYHSSFMPCSSSRCFWILLQQYVEIFVLSNAGIVWNIQVMAGFFPSLNEIKDIPNVGMKSMWSSILIQNLSQASPKTWVNGQAKKVWEPGREIPGKSLPWLLCGHRLSHICLVMVLLTITLAVEAHSTRPLKSMELHVVFASHLHILQLPSSL